MFIWFNNLPASLANKFMTRFIVIMLLYAGCCYGQKSKNPLLQTDADWKEGTITLNNGTQLEGVVKYDDKTGLITFNNGTVSKAMTARNLLGFEYFDPIVNSQRTYYCLEIPGEAGNATTTIFEVVRLFESFAVLSRIEPVEFEKKVRANAYPYNQPIGGTSQYIKISQRETIWFLPADGEPTLYLEYIIRETEGQLVDLSHDKKKIQDKDIFKKCTGSVYPAIEQYAKVNDLSFKRKEDLLKMLDFYESQVAQSSQH